MSERQGRRWRRPLKPADWLPSEVLYAFAGWLTSRDEVTVMSARHNAAPAADAVVEFCRRHGLKEPREGWHKGHHPAHEGIMTDHEHNDLDEAACMLKGRTHQTPELRHLRAINESRIYWREAAMSRRHVPPVPLPPRRERLVNRINAIFNWIDRLSDTQHSVLMAGIAIASFLLVSSCLVGIVQGVRFVVLR